MITLAAAKAYIPHIYVDDVFFLVHVYVDFDPPSPCPPVFAYDTDAMGGITIAFLFRVYNNMVLEVTVGTCMTTHEA